MTKIKLYHNDMSVCAQKVRLALAELSLGWESRHLKLRGDEQLQPEYLRINPKGQVPALVDGDVVVVESTVINEYLVDAYGGDKLLPIDSVGRSRMRWWTRQLDDDIHRSAGIMSVAISFVHQYLANTPDQVTKILASIPDEERRESKRRAFATGVDNPGLPAAARRMNKLLGDMDQTLAQDQWLAGDRFTLADIGLTPYVLRMEQLMMSMMFEDRPHLQSWLIRIKKRPSFIEAVQRWLNNDYLVLSEKKGVEARPRVLEMLKESSASVKDVA